MSLSLVNVISRARIWPTLLRTSWSAINHSAGNQTRVINYHSNSCEGLLKRRHNVLLNQVRTKKGKKQDSKAEESESEDESDEEAGDDILGGGYEDVTCNVPSLRLDNVFRGASKISRARIDEAFAESRMRHNEERTTKKSEMVVVNDVIDMILGKHADNPDMVQILRIEVLELPDIGLSTGKMKLKCRRYKPMPIANYPRDPYDGPVIYADPRDKA